MWGKLEIEEILEEQEWKRKGCVVLNKGKNIMQATYIGIITRYTYLYCIIWYLQVWYIFLVPTAIEYQHCVLLIRLRGLTWSNMFSPAQVEGYREARLWDKIFTWAEVKVILKKNCVRLSFVTLMQWIEKTIQNSMYSFSIVLNDKTNVCNL